MVVFGWDISTSIIGVSIIREDGTYLESRYLDLRKREDGLLEKAKVASWFISDLLEEYALAIDANQVHYIEDRLGNFAVGRTMLQTLMKLAAFNMAVSYIIYTVGLDGNIPPRSVVHIHPSTVKAMMKPEGLIIPKGADKKQLTLDFVTKKEKKFPLDLNRNQKPQPWCYDMADSYIIARAGLRKVRESQIHAKRKETSGNQTDSG